MLGKENAPTVTSLEPNIASLVDFQLVDIPGIPELSYLLDDYLASSNVLFLVDSIIPNPSENAK